MSLRRTPFYADHVEAGARLVPFAGFEMPVQYSGLQAEHLQTRAAVGLFDVSHMGEVRVRGPKAEAALMWLLSNAIKRIEVGSSQPWSRSQGRNVFAMPQWIRRRQAGSIRRVDY